MASHKSGYLTAFLRCSKLFYVSEDLFKKARHKMLEDIIFGVVLYFLLKELGNKYATLFESENV